MSSVASPQPKEKMSSHYAKPRLRGKPFLVGAISFFVFFAMIYAIVWLLVQSWSWQAQPPRRPYAPVSADPRWNIQAPQIQIDPATDLAKVRATENQRLNALHWNDAAHAYATIPIDEAMKLMGDAAARGQLGLLLPAPKAATPLDLQVQKSREATPPPMPNP